MRRLLLLPLMFVFLACQSAPQPAPDFSFTIEPITLEMNLGESKTFRYSLKVTGNLPSRPVLSVEQADGSPLPAGLLVNTAENPETVGVRVEEPLEAKTYNLRLKGTVGSLVRTANLELKVGDPSFALSLSQPTINVEPGSGGQAPSNVELVLQPDAGFTSTLANLELRVQRSDGTPLPAGLSYLRSTTDDPNRIRLAWFSHTSVAPGDYEVQVQAIRRNKIRIANLRITVQPVVGFSLSRPDSTRLVTQQGGNLSTQISIQRGTGFDSTINFTLRAYATGTVLVPGIVGTFDQNPTTANTVNLRIDVGNSVTACYFSCRYGLLVEATVGLVTKRLELELQVEPRYNFSLAISTSDVVVEQLIESFYSLYIYQ